MKHKQAIIIIICFAWIALGNTTPKAMTTTPAISDTIAIPNLTFKDANGNNFALSSLKGKVVFINFWATWCPPCIKEMPTINELKNSFKDNDAIVFLMVDSDGEVEKAKAFMEKHQFDLPVYASTSPMPWSFFNHAIPSTVILNKQGNVVWKYEGERDYASPESKQLIVEILENTNPQQ